MNISESGDTFDGEEKPLDPFSSRGEGVWPETADPFPMVTLLDA